MISFLISQVIGCIVFFSINFAIYGFLQHKRKKAYRAGVDPFSRVWYRSSVTFFTVIFFCGFSLRAYSLSPVIDEQSVQSHVVLMRESVMDPVMLGEELS